MKLVQLPAGRTAIRLHDGTLLACPSMRPDLPSAVRVRIFELVLTRQFTDALSLAEEANLEAAGRGALVKVRPNPTAPEVGDQEAARTTVAIARRHGVVEVPAAAVPAWGMAIPTAVPQPPVSHRWADQPEGPDRYAMHVRYHHTPAPQGIAEPVAPDAEDPTPTDLVEQAVVLVDDQDGTEEAPALFAVEAPAESWPTIPVAFCPRGHAIDGTNILLDDDGVTEHCRACAFASEFQARPDLDVAVLANGYHRRLTAVPVAA